MVPETMHCPTGTSEVDVVRGPSEATRQVETMMTADSLRLTAYGPDGHQIRFAEGAANGRRLAA